MARILESRRLCRLGHDGWGNRKARERKKKSTREGVGCDCAGIEALLALRVGPSPFSPPSNGGWWLGGTESANPNYFSFFYFNTGPAVFLIYSK